MIELIETYNKVGQSITRVENLTLLIDLSWVIRVKKKKTGTKRPRGPDNRFTSENEKADLEYNCHYSNFQKYVLFPAEGVIILINKHRKYVTNQAFLQKRIYVLLFTLIVYVIVYEVNNLLLVRFLKGNA